jgi:hypothetical protein
MAVVTIVIHRYGEGPCSGPYYTGNWFQCDWPEVPSGPHHLSQVLDVEAKNWLPLSSSVGARMSAGLLPLTLGGYGPPAPQYESRYVKKLAIKA